MKSRVLLLSLLAMKDSQEIRDTILEVVKRDDPSSEDILRCTKLVVDSGAIEKAKGMGEYYAMEALQHLGSLPDNNYTAALRELVDRVLHRDS